MPSFKSALLKHVDSIAGPAACALMSRPQRQAELRRLHDTDGPILVIRPGGIGDAVMLLPALHALKAAAPARRVDILCESRNEAVFKLAAPDSRTLAYDAAPLRTLRALRRNRYACVIDTEQFHNFSAVLAALTRAPLRIGFKINTNRRGLYTHLVGYDLDGAEDQQFGRLLEAALGRAIELPPRFGILKPMLAPPPAAAAPPGRFASASGRIAIHAGGSIASKRCSAAVLAKAVHAAAGELAPVIIGGKTDAAYAAEIESALSAANPAMPPLNLCGKTTLAESASICAASRVLLGPDSGIAHMATAAGAPSVVLFGPSDPRKWAPPEGAGIAVKVPLPCSPCSIFGYTKPCANYECMRGITSASLTAALAELLRTTNAHE